MRRAALLAFAALLACAATVGAQPSQVPSVLEGTWRRQPSAARARHIVISAFEPRLEAFPEILRGIARDRIAESLPAADRIRVGLNGSRVRITYVRRQRVVAEAPLGGTSRMQGFDEEWSRVTLRLRGGWLEQVNVNDDGRVYRLLSVEPDGQTMHLDVTVQNERLGGDVRWRIDYHR